MKKLLLAAVLLAAAISAQAQEATPRKGYVGVAFGVAQPIVNSTGLSGGAQLNLVNFGYLIGEHVGIAGTWFGTAFPVKNYGGYFVGTGGMMFGPLFSKSVAAGRIDLDVKPLIGFGSVSQQYRGQTSSSSTSLAAGLSVAARFNLGGRFSLSAGSDYYSVHPEYPGSRSSLSLVFGFNYRFN